MERNKYELQRRVLSHKYADILQDFEEASDDRRVAWNCYQQILAACEAMQGSGMENNFICCAVNKSIRKQEAEIAAPMIGPLREKLEAVKTLYRIETGTVY